MLGEQLHLICDGWELVGSPPSEREGPRSLSGLRWMPATVPGTVAGALTASAALGAEDLDASDWWFRTTFTVDVGDFGERLRLRLDGVATVSEVYLDGERLLESESMFARHALPVTLVSGYEHELVICCRALRPLLAQRRRPRARWRTALVADGNLRFHRTMVIGRAPGFAPGPPVVGPYRPVAVERHCGVSVQDRRSRAVVAAHPRPAGSVRRSAADQHRGRRARRMALGSRRLSRPAGGAGPGGRGSAAVGPR